MTIRCGRNVCLLWTLKCRQLRQAVRWIKQDKRRRERNGQNDADKARNKSISGGQCGWMSVMAVHGICIAARQRQRGRLPDLLAD